MLKIKAFRGGSDIQHSDSAVGYLNACLKNPAMFLLELQAKIKKLQIACAHNIKKPDRYVWIAFSFPKIYCKAFFCDSLVYK